MAFGFQNGPRDLHEVRVVVHYQYFHHFALLITGTVGRGFL